MSATIWYVYIVECSDASLYTGITIDLKKRLDTHNSGRGAKALKGKLPVQLVFTQAFDNGTDARKREYEIKQWKRADKLALIAQSKLSIS
jgi:putative endonuclease